MHDEYFGHKVLTFISSSVAAVITLTELELIFRTIGAGIACAIAAVTFYDMIRKRRAQGK